MLRYFMSVMAASVVAITFAVNPATSGHKNGGERHGGGNSESFSKSIHAITCTA